MNKTQHRTGYLEIFHGPMFSGKTLNLIKRLSEFADIGLKTLYINHSYDNRDGIEKAFSTNCTGDGMLSKNIDMIKVESVYDIYNPGKYEGYKVIGIDEAQFFDDLLFFVNFLVNKEHLIVIVAGLSSDYEMKPFGEILKLIAISDSEVHLTAHCRSCLEESMKIGELNVVRAPFTKRINSNKDLIDVGGSSSYVAVCRHHFFNDF